MNKIVTLLGLSVAATTLFLCGCSKGTKSLSGANDTNSQASSATASGGSAAAGPTDLKLKWQTGKKYDMQMELNQATDINVPEHPVHQELTLTQGFHYSPLKDLDNGGHQVDLEFDRQNFSLTQNGKELLNYDSTKKTPVDANNPTAWVGAAMEAMLGVPLTFTFAADGTVQKIDGLDSLTNRIAAAVPNEQQRMSLQQLYDENTMKEYGAFSRSLPGHPVNIGDSWSSSYDIDNPAGVMTVDSTYTFKGWEQHGDHNCAHLAITGDIKTKTANASQIGAVVEIQNGTINGDTWFDPDLGMFVDTKTGQDLTLNITTRNNALKEHMKEDVDVSLLSVD